MSGRLDDHAVARGLAGLPGWERDGDVLRASFERPDFAAAIAFVVRVGFLAEARDHHPDLDLRWRTVHVALTTHDAGGLTDLDLDLARAISALDG